MSANIVLAANIQMVDSSQVRILHLNLLFLNIQSVFSPALGLKIFLKHVVTGNRDGTITDVRVELHFICDDFFDSEHDPANSKFLSTAQLKTVLSLANF